MNANIRIFLIVVVLLLSAVPVSAFAHSGERSRDASGGRNEVAKADRSQLQQHGRPGSHPHGPDGQRGHLLPFPPSSNQLPQGKPGFSQRPQKPQKPFINPSLFILLAEKYSPETLNDWKATISKHQQLRASIQSLAASKPSFKPGLKPFHTEDYKGKMEEDQQVKRTFQDALKRQDVPQIKTGLANILNKLKQRNTLLEQKLATMKAKS